MGHIYEPIKSCRIIFRYKHWSPDYRGKEFYEDDFESVPKLKEYFLKYPAWAVGVGYGKGLPSVVPPPECSLIIEWTDQSGFTSKSFPTAKEFADFLKEYPPLAKALKFEIK